MHIEPLASTTSDNFFYLVHHDGLAALVDPVDHALAIDTVGRLGLELVMVLNTHWHPDHVSGDDAVLAAFPEARLLVPAAEADVISNFVQRVPDRLLSGGDTVPLGDASLSVIETPGHTVGHISFAHARHLLSGDTLFAAGTGHVRYGGDVGVLYQTYQGVLGPMPDDTTLYPGHDYSARNLEFALSIQPDHAPTQEALARVRGRPVTEARRIVPPTLGLERLSNPFLRVGDADLLAAVEARDPELVATLRDELDDDQEVCFRALRALRDSW